PAHSRSSSSLSLRCSTLTPGSTLFPYTTLFRSRRRVVTHVDAARLLDDVRDRAFVAVGDDAEVLGVGNVLDEDERAARPGADRVGLCSLEDVVAKADDKLLTGREVARHADDLRDPAGLDLHLVGEVEVEEELVPGARV